ncbi:MAG: EpsI family protein [Deltaproteobacteria bacterium]|nr:MAG: EpsI family protein [Deltaproteobacteria bacterium]
MSTEISRQKTESWRSKKEFLLLLILIAAFVTGYLGTCASLVKIWLKDGDYAYAFAIPLIAGYIIWSRRHLIAQTRTETNWMGGVFLIVFLVFSLYGILGSSPSAVRFTIPLIILSLILFCYGRQMLKILAFPVALLIFMIPLPTLVQTQIGVPLQLVSTKLGEYILRLSGVTVFVEGNLIDLGVTTLQVVEACSGLRYILPLLALGVVFIHFFEHVRWKQIVLILSTIPTAIISNALRIGITGFLAQNYNLRIAEGFFHGFSGWLIFVFALGALFVIYAIIRLLFPSSSEETESPVNLKGQLPASNSVHHTMAVIVSAVLLIVVGILSYATAALPPVRIHTGFTQFPLKINGWHGRVENIDNSIIQLSGAEDAFNGIYIFSADNIVSLYIGYRASPFNESENFFHSPSVCLPSLGWQTLAISTHEISDVPGFDKIVVRKMLIEKMGYRQLVYYWFQTKSRVSSNVNVNRLHLTLHALRRDNTHDLFIRPITPLMPGETAESASDRLDQFVRDMMGSLLKFLSTKQIDSHK